jgi:hypothetical protein
MIIDWFDVSSVVAFAEEVVLEANRLLPLVKQEGKLYAGKKEQKKFDALMTRVNTFAKNNPLNIYKKAKFLNTVKWGLRGAGHDEKLIDEMVVLLTASLNA